MWCRSLGKGSRTVRRSEAAEACHVNHFARRGDEQTPGLFQTLAFEYLANGPPHNSFERAGTGCSAHGVAPPVGDAVFVWRSAARGNPKALATSGCSMARMSLTAATTSQVGGMRAVAMGWIGLAIRHRARPLPGRPTPGGCSHAGDRHGARTRRCIVVVDADHGGLFGDANPGGLA